MYRDMSACVSRKIVYTIDVAWVVHPGVYKIHMSACVSRKVVYTIDVA